MRRLAFNQRRGVTLIELMVAIAVLSIMLAIATLTLAGEKHPKVAVASVAAHIRSLRAAAIASGVPQTTNLGDSTGMRLVTALPDGRVISDMPNLNRMSGVVRSSNAQ